MIELREKDGVTGPVAVCDHCGEVITDARRGLYVWETTGGPVLTVHKGDCDRAMPGSDPRGGNQFSMELMHLPIWLGRNLGLKTDEDWKEARDLTDSVEGL